MSQDDKPRIKLGVTTAASSTMRLMRYETRYRIRLPDHDFPVGRDHKLISSVYGCFVIDEKLGVTTSGPTFISVRSGGHDLSTAVGYVND